MVVDLERVKLAMVFSEFVGGSPENSNLAKNTPIFFSFFVFGFGISGWALECHCQICAIHREGLKWSSPSIFLIVDLVFLVSAAVGIAFFFFGSSLNIEFNRSTL